MSAAVETELAATDTSTTPPAAPSRSVASAAPPNSRGRERRISQATPAPNANHASVRSIAPTRGPAMKLGNADDSGQVGEAHSRSAALPSRSLWSSAPSCATARAHAIARLEASNTWQAARADGRAFVDAKRSEEHTSELQSRENLVCRLLLEKKKD